MKEVTRRNSTYCIPLQFVHINVQKVVQTYCGPYPDKGNKVETSSIKSLMAYVEKNTSCRRRHTMLLQFMHLRFSGSLRRLRMALSIFSSSFILRAISYLQPTINRKVLTMILP
ncbi:hypothetical protein SAY87_023242 [Trapa incisa]|uniref:Uncharacterized protein n=1 Tax=Trapa incisa TaxID=236973 RepID=A0AAN7Q5I8_9MYRT|nr:hypothetical protein SAY87_023242 [Trapa incisa]